MLLRLLQKTRLLDPFLDDIFDSRLATKGLGTLSQVSQLGQGGVKDFTASILTLSVSLVALEMGMG